MKCVKLLILAQIPPPYLGQAMMNMEFINNLPSNLAYVHLKMQMSKDSEDFGRMSLSKLYSLFKLHIKLFWILMFSKVEYVYFQPSGPVNVKTIIKDFPTILLLKIFRKKIIYHFHADRFSRLLSEKSNFKSFIFQKIYSSPYSVIVILPHQKVDLFWLNPKKFYLLPNGLEDKYSLNYLVPRGNNHFVLLYVGLLVSYKGIKDIILIASILKERGIIFKVDLIGGWSSLDFEREIKLLVKTLNLNDFVTFHGPKVETEKWKFFANSDILIHPSYEDLMPLSFIEGMMFGLPILTTDLEPFKYLVKDNKNGFLIKKGNLNMFVDKLIHLYDNSEVLKQMSKFSREEFLRNYSIDIFRKNLNEIIEDL